MGKFNEVSNLFRDIAQGTGFYTKLNDILARMDNDIDGLVAARQMEARDIEQSLGKRGGGGAPNLPSMYPNQQPEQNLGFFVPPPMHFDGPQNHPQGGFGGFGGGGMGGSLKNMLSDLMSSKPSFDTNLWGTNHNVYQSKYK